MKECVFINDNSIRAIQYPKTEMLPQEYHIGNRLISDTDTEQPMIVYSIKTRGLQKEAYDASDALPTDEESELSISIHDAYLPPQSKFVEYGIYKQDNIYRGTFLSIDNIWKFSAIGFEMLCLCLMNTFAGEKTVLYHNKLNSFGIKQYATILNYNGFIKYGSQPLKDSICRSCRRTYAEHSLSLEERLKHKVCNEFAPMVYDYLTGDLDTSERMFIVKDVYNNPLNINGSLISVLFISDVAYAGVNLLSTHNLIFLSKVSNISKWKQIYGRIVRVNSHALFPEEKQHVKIYTFVIEGSKEGDRTTKLVKESELTREEKYYKRNIILNVDIAKYMNKLAKASVSSVLFNSPEKLQFEISRDLLVMFINDVYNEFETVIQRTTHSYNASEWELNTYVERIMDRRYAMSYIDFSLFSPEFIKRLIQRSNLITVFTYKTGGLYVRVNERKVFTQYQVYNSINYLQLRQLENSKKSLSSLLKQYRTENSTTKKAIVLYNICKLYSGKFEELKDIQPFWEYIYEFGDEYYEDDETNFFYNHSKKNRSMTKVVGFYYGNNIVLRNGTIKRVPITYVSHAGIDKYPYVYRILSVPDKGVIGENSPFYLHVKILKKTAGDEIDRRKLSTGVTCFTTDITELRTYFPKIKISAEMGYKREFCKELMFALCEEQYNEKRRFVYSPFEHF